MNIVKGVADLLRRSTGTQAGEGSQWGQGDRFSAPSTRICFGDVGEEAVLKSLWQRYVNAIDKMEKRKWLQVFLMQFIQTYKNWEPDKDSLSDSMPTHPSSEYASGFQGVVIGCSAGHPSEVILILIQELTRITALITDMNSSSTDSSADLSFSIEGLYILNSFDIITRSIHNCRVFSYYGGVQKVIALLKAKMLTTSHYQCLLFLSLLLASLHLMMAMSPAPSPAADTNSTVHHILVLFGFP
ncbi:hypothetical protein Taro_001293 [Colocasia esculenta]|uniref:Uncharacterized protein n=1 Tax=Colocasia esculenta TaxID=4460 RepID=A0A843TFI8_COLES|nr:hypothetical protein [Colocasia esculenta]